MKKETSVAVLEREKFYQCEVKRRRRKENGGGYEAFWKVKNVQDALDDNDTEFRCKDCHGAVKLYKRRSADGAPSHVEHVSRPDSEYCPASAQFQGADDGRAPRLSQNPVH